jgi:hypothetical protein
MAVMIRRLLLLALTALPACAPVVVPIPVPVPLPQPKPQTQLIGRGPDEVVALLGSPSLDRTEGPARQLQFMNASCVLDVFFYPDRRSGRVAATHVEARSRTGQAFDTQSCVEALAARG